MAFVVVRRDGRFEIRESVSTPRGPRARSLVTFRVLTDEVLDLAESRATTPFDRARLRHRAQALNVPRRETDLLALAYRLAGEIATGRAVPPAGRLALGHALQTEQGEAPDTIAPVLDWLGAGMGERGDALRDLLRMTDRIPRRPTRTGPRFPRLTSAPA